MNLLITGATGFIGSYFVDKYSEEYVIKRFSFQRDNFENLDLKEIETLIHLSALVHQINGASAKQYEEINVLQTVNLAKKAKKSGVKHFIFMSTVKVYGEETFISYNENSPCQPEDDYGKSKYKAEQALQKLADETFIISIIRPPIVYGHGVKANIKNLVTLVNKMPILPFGEIHNKRSIIYVGNLSHLITCVIEQRQGGIFLASDDAPLSTTVFIQLIASALNKKVYLIKSPFFELLLKWIKPSFHKRLYQNFEVNNTATKEKLRLKNPYTTKEGINSMIHGEAQ
jgi:UDP-glucose 4-epimerase